MSRDIRSFFTPISKKVASTEKDKKTTSIEKDKKSTLNSSDIIPDTPDDGKKHKKSSKNSAGSKRKRIVSLDSDSESEKELIAKPPKTPKNEAASTRVKGDVKTPPKSVNTKKFVTPLEVFGNAPVKQAKNEIKKENDVEISKEKVVDVKKEPELNIHNDDDFEKTLLELDEEELMKNVATDNGHEMESPKKEKSKTPNRKRKTSSSNEDGGNANADEERYERKRHSALLYQKYLNRSGPIHLGSKWTPKGKADCLKGLCFIITGVLESLEREQAENLIKEHGGRCTSSVTGKVNYMVLGDEAGPAKIEKAKKLGTKMISEDDLIDLICIKSGITNKNIKSDCSTSNTETCEKQTEEEEIHVPKKKPKKVEAKPTKSEIKKENDAKISKAKIIEVKPMKANKVVIKQESLQWVDKYKPKVLSDIIGQQGERSNVKKLASWLENWQKNRARETVGKGIPRPSPWAKDDDGAFFRAALLSGPPGVGKTTTATLVCKQLGFDTVEFNASDTRNKKMVHNEVAQIIKSTSLAGFFNDGSAPSRRHVLLMDEVDGMSGNEDRGGIQELISIIKTSDIPIVCMCNDRQHPKIRTLANYCFDLRFSKPRLEQIRGAMMSICFKEGIKIKADVVGHIIEGTCQDIRQTLNQLSLYTANASNSDSNNRQLIEKDVKLGPWEVIRKVFSEEEHKGMSLIDKSKLFFHDYSIGPLFVQENYLKVIPHCAKKEQLQRFADAADAISMGDVVDSRIRTTQNWALLDLQSMYASVLPGHYLEGHFGGQIDFPGWLGKNSKANKFKRMLSEINAHTRMSISGDRTAISLDYVRCLRDAIANPMLKKGSDGIQESMAVMRAYNLLREDLTNLVELAHWPKTKDPFEGIDSKVKAGFTRAYNKEAPALPYAAPGAGAVKNKKGAAALNDADDPYTEYDEAEADADADEGDEKDDISNDAMIKTKKASKGKTAAKPKGAASSKRGAKK